MGPQRQAEVILALRRGIGAKRIIPVSSSSKDSDPVLTARPVFKHCSVGEFGDRRTVDPFCPDMHDLYWSWGRSRGNLNICRRQNLFKYPNTAVRAAVVGLVVNRIRSANSVD